MSRLTVVVLCALALAACGRAPAERSVLLVTLDTARVDLLGVYGGPGATPRIDAFAATAVRFERAFTTDFWTLPAHASLLTGEYPTSVGATSETNRLPAEATTLAERLRAAGYRTAGFVGNPWLTVERGFAQGFEHYEAMWQRSELPDEEFADDSQAIASALRFVDEVAGGPAPFFVFVNAMNAHLPYAPAPETLRLLVPEPRPAERVRELYDAEIRMLDGLIGGFADALRERDLLDRTIFVVTSDHGENIGDHGMIDHMFSMYDTTIRVPLLIRYPPAFPAGAVRRDLASLVDLAPTLLELTGIDAGTAPLGGTSLVAREQSPPRFVLAENDRPLNGIEVMKTGFPDFDLTRIDRRMRMLRTDRHKLIWQSDGSVELYDLEHDPDEQVDLAEVKPELRDQLRALLETWMAAEARGEPRALFEGTDEQAREQLRALGYVE